MLTLLLSGSYRLLKFLKQIHLATLLREVHDLNLKFSLDSEKSGTKANIEVNSTTARRNPEDVLNFQMLLVLAQRMSLVKMPRPPHAPINGHLCGGENTLLLLL